MTPLRAMPAAISTLPSGSRVAVWSKRGSTVLPVGTTRPVESVLAVRAGSGSKSHRHRKRVKRTKTDPTTRRSKCFRITILLWGLTGRSSPLIGPQHGHGIDLDCAKDRRYGGKE